MLILAFIFTKLVAEFEQDSVEADPTHMAINSKDYGLKPGSYIFFGLVITIFTSGRFIPEMRDASALVIMCIPVLFELSRTSFLESWALED